MEDPNEPKEDATVQSHKEESGSGLRGSHLRFLKRDEWFALIPLQVLVQRVDGPTPSWGELYPAASEGAFQLCLQGPMIGLLEVGNWSCRVCGERGAGLRTRLTEFYKAYNPERLASVDALCEQFGSGGEDELNALLSQSYSANLTELPENALEAEGDYAITFPDPYAKRAKFIQKLVAALTELATFRSEVPHGRLSIDSAASPASVTSPSVSGFPHQYLETMVPERRGPLKQREDGSAEYGAKIEAGGHKIAQNIRGGSKWVSEKLLEGTKNLSEQLGPAKDKAEIHPHVEKGLTLAKRGSDKLLDFTKDVLGGLGTLASHGVNWTADKITSTETYQEWEKKPEGPRSKALKELAGSTVGAVLSVGYGIRDGAHTIIEEGIKKSVVHASEARWGAEAGSAADKTCQSVINVHYAALNGAAFIEKGAKEVVGKVASLALLDAGSKAVVIDDLKNSKVYKQGPLLYCEASGFGITKSRWTGVVAVLREKSLALYVVSDEQKSKAGWCGIRVSEEGEERRKVVAHVEAGGGAQRSGVLEEGDIIVGVEGSSVETMSVEQVEERLRGPVGSMASLTVCNGQAMRRYVTGQLRSEAKAAADEGSARKDDNAVENKPDAEQDAEKEKGGKLAEKGEDIDEDDDVVVVNSVDAETDTSSAEAAAQTNHRFQRPTMLTVGIERTLPVTNPGGGASPDGADSGSHVAAGGGHEGTSELKRERSRFPPSEDWTYFPVQSPTATESQSSQEGEEVAGKGWLLFDTQFGRGKLHRIVLAQDMRGAVTAKHEDRVHCLSVESHSQRRGFIFQAPSEDEERAWRCAVEECVARYDAAMGEVDITIRLRESTQAAPTRTDT